MLTADCSLNVDGNAAGARRTTHLQYNRDRAWREAGRDLHIHLEDAGHDPRSGAGELRAHGLSAEGGGDGQFRKREGGNRRIDGAVLARRIGASGAGGIQGDEIAGLGGTVGAVDRAVRIDGDGLAAAAAVEGEDPGGDGGDGDGQGRGDLSLIRDDDVGLVARESEWSDHADL